MKKHGKVMVRWMFLVTLAAALAGGCKKDKVAESAPGAAPADHAAQAANLKPSPLFAHIPADTPYVFASFEPLPASYWKKLGTAFGPTWEKLIEQAVAQPAEKPGERFLQGILGQLKGHLDGPGIERTFGISARSRFAFYGVGLVPVMRIELTDGAVLSGTVARAAKAADFTPPTATLGKRTYWRIPKGDVVLVAAIDGNQLVVSFGPAVLVDKALPVILGVKNPDHSMADGAALKALVARYGFGPTGVGYVDAHQLLTIVTAAGALGGAGDTPFMSSGCQTALARAAGHFPRLVVGYDQVTDAQMTARVVLETDPGIAGRLKALQVEVPGMADGQLADKALFAMGGGVDLGKARAAGIDAADGLAALGQACAADDVVASARRMKESLSEPLPPGFDKIRGGLMEVTSAELAGGRPSNVSGFLLLAADDPAKLLDLLEAQLPSGKLPKMNRDGHFHAIIPAGTIPGLGAVEGAVLPRALAVSMGADGQAAVQKALSRHGTSPLVLVSYDYGRLMKMIGSTMPVGAAEAGFMNMTGLFGQLTMWAYPSDHGLAVAMRMEMGK